MKSLAVFSLVGLIGLNLHSSVQASSPGAPCLWMGPIQSLNSNARFQRKSLARAFKQSRHEGTLGSLLCIEEVTDVYQGTRNGAGQLVAWINDGEMSCVLGSLEPEKNENE